MNEDLAAVARNLVTRMVEIDERLTKSLYRNLTPEEQDESPTGDDYNLLWDAILDEFHAVGVDLAGMLQAHQVRSR